MEDDGLQRPRIFVVGGPNGAGKTTTATRFLPADLLVRQFVNADVIASGLSAFAPETAALQAGRIMLGRLAELARQRKDFAFETTLASRTFAPFLRERQREGYEVQVIYVWLRTPELAVTRVAARVRRGGHHVPPEVVTRRYWRGLANFVHLYRPLADAWILCDNSDEALVLVALGEHENVQSVVNEELYDEIERSAARGAG
jgi:predicted ABC-type ATPase